MDEPEQLIEHLRVLGVTEGMTVLVHASLRSLGLGPQSGQLLVDALLHCVGPGGTVLSPTLSYEHVTVDHPYFDVRSTPSNIGAWGECFRRQQGMIRSLHPTHSVGALGALAMDLTGEHHLDRTPCGPSSPYRKLRDHGGYILMIGCTLRPNTSMHGVEELVEPPYLFAGEADFTVTNAQGQECMVPSRLHDFKGYVQRYERMANLLDVPDLRIGRVAAAESFLIHAPTLWEAGERMLRENPFYLVDRE